MVVIIDSFIYLIIYIYLFSLVGCFIDSVILIVINDPSKSFLIHIQWPQQNFFFF